MDPAQWDACSLEAGTEEEEEIETPRMALWTAIILLVVITAVRQGLISLTVVRSDLFK